MRRSSREGRYAERSLTGVDDVLQAIAQRRTAAQGRSRGAGGTARYVAKAVGEWIGRGMRRI